MGFHWQEGGAGVRYGGALQGRSVPGKQDHVLSTWTWGRPPEGTEAGADGETDLKGSAFSILGVFVGDQSLGGEFGDTASGLGNSGHKTRARDGGLRWGRFRGAKRVLPETCPLLAVPAQGQEEPSWMLELS